MVHPSSLHIYCRGPPSWSSHVDSSWCFRHFFSVVPHTSRGHLSSAVLSAFLRTVYSCSWFLPAESVVVIGVPMTATDTTIQQPPGLTTTDARKSRKAVFRRTIDYNASVINYIKERIWVGGPSDRWSLQPDYLWSPKVLLRCVYSHHGSCYPLEVISIPR